MRRLIYPMVFLVCCGCGRSVYPPMEGAYYIDPDADLRDIGNAAMVTFENRTAYPELAKEVTDLIYLGLQKRQRFGLRIVDAQDPSIASLDIRPNMPVDPQTCAKVYKALSCSGLITGQITEYRPFPHLVIGLRLRLVDLRNARVVWAVEQIWDAQDRSVMSRIRDYIAQQKRTTGSMAEQLTVISSIDFLGFVAYEISRTL